jgi:hypothetical protein
MTTTYTFEIDAFIDGRDQLIVQGGTLQWDHLDFAAVGRNSAGNGNEPTVITTSLNGVTQLDHFDWYPSWPEPPPAEIRYQALSSVFSGLLPALPSTAATVTLNVISARDSLSIYQYPTAANSNTLILDFNDDQSSGPAWYDALVTVTTDAPAPVPPVVTASNVQLANGQTSVAASSLFTASDPNGDAITQYVVFDATAGSGYFQLGGTIEPSGAPGFYVTPAQYAELTFIPGPGGSSDHIYVGAFADSLESAVVSFYVTAPIDAPPIMTPLNKQLIKGQTSVAVSTLFTASDPDGDTITQYAVFDATSGSGHFEVGGTPMPSAVAGFYITPQQYQTTIFVAGPGGSSDHIYVAAFDGTQEGPVTDFYLSAPIETLPVVTPLNKQMTKGQTSAAASTLFAASDVDGDTITQYAVFDATAGSGHFEVGGAVEPSAVGGFYITPQQYQTTTFVPGPGGSSDHIYVAAFDGSSEGRATDFYVSAPTETPPVITASDFHMTKGQTSVAASNLFTASDPDSDAITQFALFDATAGSGHFEVGGAVQPSAVAGFYLTPQQYQTTIFVAGPNGSSDHIYVAAFDGPAEGPVTDFYVSVPIDTPAVITASNFQMGKGQTSVGASSLFTASDPDGDTITQYAVFDATAGSGNFSVGGVVQPSAVAGFYLTPQQYQTTTFVAGPNGSSDHVYVAAFDGAQEGPVTDFYVTAPIDAPPVVTASNFEMAAGQTTVAASTLFTASDPDGDTVTQYAVFDGTAGSGHFAVGGVVQPSAVAGFYLTPQQYQTATFVAGPNGSTDHVYVAAFDGAQEGPVTDFYVAAPPGTPPVVTASNMQLSNRNAVAAATLFNASDTDGSITQYAIFDSTSGSGYFQVGGTVEPSGSAGFYINPDQLQQTYFHPGLDGASDHIYVKAYDGTQWSAATDFYLTAPPLFAVQLDDPNNLSQDAALVADMQAAAADWAQYLNGLGTVNIELTVAPTIRANGGPDIAAPAGTDGVRTVYESGAVYEMLNGAHYKGDTTDIDITVDPTYLQDVLWLDPNPSSPSAIASNRIDGVTVMRHELAHGLGITTYRDPTTGALPADHEMTWDELTQIHSDGSAWFTGANAEAVYGGPVPVTTLQNGEQYAHLGNSVDDADGQDLMNGVEFDYGTAYHISALDLAMLKDLGAPITTLTPQSAPVAGFAGGGTVTLTATLMSNAAAVTVNSVGTLNSGSPSVALLGQHLASALVPTGAPSASFAPDPSPALLDQGAMLSLAPPA